MSSGGKCVTMDQNKLHSKFYFYHYKIFIFKASYLLIIKLPFPFKFLFRFLKLMPKSLLSFIANSISFNNTNNTSRLLKTIQHFPCKNKIKSNRLQKSFNESSNFNTRNSMLFKANKIKVRVQYLFITPVLIVMIHRTNGN